MGPAAPAVWLGMERAVAGLSPEQSMQKGGCCIFCDSFWSKTVPWGPRSLLAPSSALAASIRAGGGPLALIVALILARAHTHRQNKGAPGTGLWEVILAAGEWQRVILRIHHNNAVVCSGYHTWPATLAISELCHTGASDQALIISALGPLLVTPARSCHGVPGPPRQRPTERHEMAERHRYLYRYPVRALAIQ